MKENELTWEDIDKIDRILEKMIREDLDNHLEWYESRKNYYTEALRRFKEAKK